ncbi:MAG: PhzF family phenazine biosynthesis protein, partial [Betaproteobacteria bacterium]
MTSYPFRIINVFAEERLAGNPLAVFEDGHGLDDATMQALALQFNLSETTFILPSTRATVTPARISSVTASRDELAAMLGLVASDIGSEPLFVDTGSEQLLVPLMSVAAVRRCQPTADLLVKHGSVALPGGGSRAMAYVWAEVAPDGALAR